MVIFNLHRQEVLRLDEPKEGINVSSTPWVGDLDHDGWLDVVYCVVRVRDDNSDHPAQITIHRLEKEIFTPGRIDWGAYMGSEYNGVFRGTRTVPPSL